jgi:hypothetical protein
MKIIIAMIPKVYDTPRVVRILDVDGQQTQATIDVNSPQPIDKSGVSTIFNPQIGKYDLSVEVGPSYNTKRQEAAQSMQELVHAYPDMMAAAGDLIVQNFDWANAKKLAERLKLMLPPPIQQALANEGQMTPELQQAQMMMEEMQKNMEQVVQQAEAMKAELDSKEKELEIKQFEAETKRLAAMKEEQAQGAMSAEPSETELEKLDLERRKMEQAAWEAEEKLKIDWYNAETARMKLDLENKKAEMDSEHKDMDRAVSMHEGEKDRESAAQEKSEPKEDD